MAHKAGERNCDVEKARFGAQGQRRDTQWNLSERPMALGRTGMRTGKGVVGLGSHSLGKPGTDLLATPRTLNTHTGRFSSVEGPELEG